MQGVIQSAFGIPEEFTPSSVFADKIDKKKDTIPYNNRVLFHLHSLLLMSVRIQFLMSALKNTVREMQSVH